MFSTADYNHRYTLERYSKVEINSIPFGIKHTVFISTQTRKINSNHRNNLQLVRGNDSIFVQMLITFKSVSRTQVASDGAFNFIPTVVWDAK